MKFIDEYRDPVAARRLVTLIARTITRPWTLMEVCGGQTHAIVKFGIDELLPGQIRLIHGPGCPVCVTPLELVDKAIQIASRLGVIFASFGDMLRVPGSTHDLLSVKARGGDVRIVYSPLDAVKIARENPDSEVVFFAVGFETTAPANAMAVFHAKREGLRNFSLLVSHVLVPPAIEAILSSPDNCVDAFLAAGHVCAIMGTEEYSNWNRDGTKSKTSMHEPCATMETNPPEKSSVRYSVSFPESGAELARFPIAAWDLPMPMRSLMPKHASGSPTTMSRNRANASAD